ncbi:MAG: triose-phosphate isomerase [candidate division Zixibacteria bacterium]|nr:triose-phosphate isomerase [candidate division Zixibacteria bacterium]
MRLKIIAGNWKMNKTNPEAAELTRALVNSIGKIDRPRVVLCPPFTALSEMAKVIKGSSIFLGAQNIYCQESGAYTGEIAPGMLLTIGVAYVILGHSERREYFSETDNIVNAKVKLALKTGLIPIVCVGEKLADRENGKTEEVVGSQMDGSLDSLSGDEIKKVAIAYEPVWAIGTGKTATTQMAQEVHVFIRNTLKRKYGEAAETVSILYGGSVNAENAASLLKEEDMDGALVGGASLKADQFTKIVNSV